MNVSKPFLPNVSSTRGLSRALLAAVALSAGACTFEIQDPGNGPSQPGDPNGCPSYNLAACTEGSYGTTYTDEQGCEVPECVLCPAVDAPRCAPGEVLVKQTDKVGCLTPVCIPEPTNCPAYDLAPCPPGSQIEYVIDEQGCKVPQCSNTGCAELPVPYCAPGEHIEYVGGDCGCPQPQCVPDAGCGAMTKIAIFDDAGATAPNCGCPPYALVDCGPDQVTVTSYDPFGCPVYTCQTTYCPTDSEVRYVSQDPMKCQYTKFVCQPGEEMFSDPSCGCGCRVAQDPGCVVGGCSGQLCGEAGADLISTCEWQEQYACFQKLGSCERQADGQCGWTPTDELRTCLGSTGMP